MESEFRVIELGTGYAVLRHVPRPGQKAVAPDIILRRNLTGLVLGAVITLTL